MQTTSFTCEQARQIDLVDYLQSLGHQPQKISLNSYWYLSPLREETAASFKVNGKLNLWYDFGIGRGGDLIDFGVLYHHCTVPELLQKLCQENLSFHPHVPHLNVQKKSDAECQNLSLKDDGLGENGIRIIDAKQSITDLFLCHYLHKRRINKNVADRYCHEVSYTVNNRIYKAVGFKNTAGGYELRNEFFKGSCSPKYVTYFDNQANNISVFEGFFDFLGYQTMLKNQEQCLTNLPIRQTSFLVLNSLSFFDRSLLLMEKHEGIHLYLDNDNTGKKFTQKALKRSTCYQDESKLYKGYKDLNDWLMHFGKAQKLIQSRGRHL